ncbi:MAG: rRNA maturation RNase YbeY [Methylobacteriaceae bacterium]|nr:rRNA maturation RNase YbeY [Methylobacteriaceae bacterium]MBV9701920.1 rRNA maturation RNase YbeY [Methylobacteriaceae bacterium]
MTVLVEVSVAAPAWSTVEGMPAKIERALEESASQSGVALAPHAEVSVLLCDDETIRDLNRTWRSIDRPTNVLSFPAGAPPGLASAALLGDVVVAFETAAREAEGEGKPFSDHVIHLVVHGFLHLLGYDHGGEAEAALMERLEARILARLGIADPYAERVLAHEASR